MNKGIGKIQITIIVFLILLMVIPPVSPHTSSTPSHKLNGISLNYSLQTPVKNVNKSNNTPKYIFPLSNSTKLDMENGHITPINYNRSPAPMGISDLGLVNSLRKYHLIYGKDWKIYVEKQGESPSAGLEKQ